MVNSQFKFNLKSIIVSGSSSKVISPNSLDLTNYLISHHLHNSLFGYYKDKSNYSGHSRLNRRKTVKDIEGVYIISFNVLNKDKKELVYNYIYYNDDLYLTLIVYFLLRSYFIRKDSFNEWGLYLVLLDNIFLEYNNVDYYIDLLSKNSGVNIKWNYPAQNNYLKGIMDLKYRLDIKNLVQFSSKLLYVGDYEKISNLLDYSYNKNYYEYVKIIYDNICPTKFTDHKVYNNIDSHLTNPFSKQIFVVQDKEALLNSVREKGFDVGEGPKPWRGQINSINSFLNYFDTDYRKSLYYHYNYHYNKGNIDKNLPLLGKKHFSFRNIHQNIGNVRWFSTTNKKLDRQNLFEDSFRIIEDELDSNRNLNKVDLQYRIEEILFNQESIYSDNNFYKKLNFTDEAFMLLKTKRSELISLMSNDDVYTSKSNTHSTEYIPWVKKLLNVIGSKSISDLLISYFMQILTKETVKIDDIDTSGIPTITAYDEFGGKIVSKYIYIKYLEYKNIHKLEDLSLSQFKKINDFSEMFEDNFNARVGGFFVWNLVTVGLIYQELDSNPLEPKQSVFYLRIQSKIRSVFIKNNYKVFHLPMRLPMICKPKDYVYSQDFRKNILGGYLLNDLYYTDHIFKEKIGYGKTTVLHENNLIVDLINGLAKTPYKININTLEFINKFGIDKKMVIDPSGKEIKSFIDNPYKKMNKRDAKKYRSLLSKIIMEKNILSIAQVYSKVDKIYFPVRLDQRTRIYCETDYFDYQKTDLAKGLINFADPGYIFKYNTNVIKYFKAYGANMYGDGLDKKSLNYRVKWVDDHSSKLLDFENNNIVNNAENKTCFVSFCFEYKRFIKFMEDKNLVRFCTYLPIQLDASCNCYQHLALLTKEGSLLSKLNLTESTHDDTPSDFYSYIVDKIDQYIHAQIEILSKLKDKNEKQIMLLDSFRLLSEVKFDRSIVKHTIMTKSYNAGIPKQVDLILTNLDQHYEGKQQYYTYKQNNIKIKRSDIVNFVLALKEVIQFESPRIKELSKYLDGIVSICIKLSIPIPWKLPSGAEINESYYAEEKYTIPAFSFVKSKYTFTKFLKNKYSLSKIKRATMPNLIHSLDATSIALLYEDFKKVGSLYTIHDCFAVTANNVPKLISILKLVYIKLYSDSGYLKQFDEWVRLSISNTSGEKIFNPNDKYINIPKKDGYIKTPFPDVNQVLNIDSNNRISSLTKSSYIII